MICTCPYCNQVFDSSELAQPAGIGGGSYCPKCQEHVRISFPYGWAVAIISLLLAVATLLVAHATSPLTYLIGTPFLWIFYSLFLNAYSTRLKRASIRKWKPRRRTFFEWLYDRGSTPRLINKDR